MSPTILTIWIVSMVLRTVLAWVLFSRRLYRDVPIFTVYIVENWLSSVLFFSFEKLGYRYLYYYGYWLDEAICLALDFWMLFEIFGRVLRDYPMMRKVGLVTLRLIVGVMVLSAAILWATEPVDGFGGFFRQMVQMARSVKVAQLILILGLFGFCWYAGLPLRRQERGVALGLAVISAFNVAGWTLMAKLGSRVHEASNVAIMLAFATAEAIWIYYLMTEDRLTCTPTESAQCMEWNAALKELVER